MHLRLVGEGGVEQLQLNADGCVVTKRVEAGAVHHMHQHARALAVPQELVAQPTARMRALQQACAGRLSQPAHACARLSQDPGASRATPARSLLQLNKPRAHPGMSAKTVVRKSSWQTPRLGTSVVKG